MCCIGERKRRSEAMRVKVAEARMLKLIERKSVWQAKEAHLLQSARISLILPRANEHHIACG